MNVTIMDAFICLMMDRIIFLGVPINMMWPILYKHN